MAKRSSLRASDADRDHVAERLRVAAMEGRIYAHELEERLAKALRARTYGELDEVVDDLPGAPASVPIPVAVTARRPVHLELLRRHPVALAIVGAVLGVVIAGMVAAIIAVAASGVWLLPVILYFAFRARFLGAARGSGRRRRHRFEDPRVQAHARRSWRF